VTYRPASDADFGTLVTLHGPSVGARIAVCCAGHCTLTCHGERLVLTPGQSAFIPDSDGPVEISTTGTVRGRLRPVTPARCRTAGHHR